MGRWQPDARARLQEAALALYGERGYEETTVAEIAERAGLTKRTFFRYFTDKREVLFWGSELLEQQMVGAIEAAPASASALGMIGAALDAAAAALTGTTIMHVAFEQWVDDPNQTPFQQIARDALAQLREIAATG